MTYTTHGNRFDRTYWRSQSAERLCDEALSSGCELTIAMGERLEALRGSDQDHADALLEIEELNQRIDALMATQRELMDEIKHLRGLLA